VRAIQASHLRHFDDYAEVEIDLPSPRPREVRVKVAAVGIGYFDSLVALGGYQVKPALPHIPGVDIAGTIDAVGDGENVGGWTVGDRVAALATRGLAEYALAPAALTLRLPDVVSFAQGATVPLNYLTALHALRDRALLRAGETLLIFGAAGGVGLAAIQVGRALGARVIAVGSTAEKRAFAIGHGAEVAVDTVVAGWRERLRTALDGRPLGAVFDPVCGPLFEAAFRSLGWGGRHLVVGFVGGPIPALPANLSLMKGAALVGVDERQFVQFEPDRAAAHLAQLNDWLGRGVIIPPVGRCFEWLDHRAALDFAFRGEGLGKTLIRTPDATPALAAHRRPLSERSADMVP
jgi:NADPH2:quinone reductase